MKKWLSLVALTIVLGAIAFSAKTSSRQLTVLPQKEKDALLKRVENSSEQPLRVAENADSPLRIARATVKEIPGPTFTKLTGRATDLPAVSGVPEVALMNTSGKTVTSFVLAIRDPKSRTTRTLVQRKISIPPGETYIVKREHFVNPEKVTVASADGPGRQILSQPRMDSEKYWLPFAGRSELFITVGRVTFDDGSSWTITEGGEIR